MRTFTLFLFFCLLTCLSLQAQLKIFPELGAQRAGISALSPLKIEVSPRAAALGGATTCLTGDGYSAYVNPAGMAELDNFSFAAANTFWVADINYAFLSASKPYNFGTLGLSVSALNSGAMEVRTTFQPEGTGELFYANYYTVGLSYARQLTQQFAWGATVKFVQEQLAEFRANTGVLDIGFLYETDVKKLRFAVLLQNFGPNSTLRGSREVDTTFNTRDITLDSYPAPTTFKIGISMVPWESEDKKQSLMTTLQLDHPSDNAESIRFGLEYAYMDLLYLRAGYQFNVDDQAFPTAGIGLRSRVGRHPMYIDYGFTPNRFLGSVHRIGVNFRLNPVEK
ncbi:MAG: PorV/PorQ family protein [Bacteroidota bacterium]